MSYDFTIERDSDISLDEWKQAVASVEGLRLDDGPSTATNPRTGTTITVDGNDGDVAMMIEDEWIKVFQYLEGQVTFKGSDQPDDAVMKAAIALCRILSAEIIGDEGETIWRTD